MCMCIPPSGLCDRTYTNELPEASSPRNHTHSKGTPTHETHHHPRFSSNDEGIVSRYLFKLTRAARARTQRVSRRALIRVVVIGRRAANALLQTRGPLIQVPGDEVVGGAETINIILFTQRCTQVPRGVLPGLRYG